MFILFMWIRKLSQTQSCNTRIYIDPRRQNYIEIRSIPSETSHPEFFQPLLTAGCVPSCIPYIPHSRFICNFARFVILGQAVAGRGMQFSFYAECPGGSSPSLSTAGIVRARATVYCICATFISADYWASAHSTLYDCGARLGYAVKDEFPSVLFSPLG